MVDKIKQELINKSHDVSCVEEYINLIEQAQSENRRRYTKSDSRYCYYEEHHILPRSLYSEYINDKENKVLLTPYEHYNAHKLLCSIFPGQQMSYAFWKMTCTCNRVGINVSAEEYAYARYLYSQCPGTHTGKHPSRETKDKISAGVKRFWESGGYAHTEEQHKKAVKTRRERGLYNRSCEQKVSTSNKLSGRIFVNNGVSNKRIYPEELDTYLEGGWMRGKKPLSEEHKKNIGKAGKGKEAWNKGKPGTFLGRTHTEESKQKMRDAKRRGKNK